MAIPPNPSGMEPQLGAGSRSAETERWYQAHDLYREAQVWLVRQDRPAAAALLRRAVEISPQHAEARALLATIEQIEQQEREVQAARAAPEWAEMQRQPETRLSQWRASINVNGSLGMAMVLTTAVLGMIGGIVTAIALVALADLGTMLRYGGYWMMVPLAGGMFCGAACGLFVYFHFDDRPVLAIVPALLAALLAGAVGGIILPFAMLLAALAAWIGWVYRRLRERTRRGTPR